MEIQGRVLVITRYDYAVICVYLVFLTSLGWIFRRFNRGSRDYFAGGFRVAWWLLGASSFMSNFSCWLFTGAANIAYTHGILIFGFYAIDVLGFLVSVAWFAPRFRQLRLVTAMDAVRLRFGRASEQFFTWLNFASSIGIAAVWLVSLAVILSSAFRISSTEVIFATGAVVSLIALLGGNWAVVTSDFIQLVVLLAVTIAASALTLVRLGGIGPFLAQIPADHWRLLHPVGSIPYDWLYLVTGLISATYMKNNFAYAAKYIAAKDGTDARKSALIPLAGYLVMPAIWFIPPLAAFTLVPDLPQHSVMRIPGEAAYIAVVLQVLPTGLVGLMIAGMFSATIASMDVALNKNAGFFVQNFYQPILRPSASDRELLWAGEIATAAFGAVITGLALAMTGQTNVSLFDAFLYLNAYLGVPLFLPMFLGMLIKRVPPWSGWATTVVGMLTTGFFYNFAPTALGRMLLEPVCGGRIYSYVLTNKFVMTHLVGVPLAVVFFLLTRLWYRKCRGSEYERETEAFFTRMETPVDFEREVGNDNTPRQARLLGGLACGYGAFIALLLFIPNPPSGRIAIAAIAGTVSSIGAALLGYARWLGAAANRPRP